MTDSSAVRVGVRQLFDAESSTFSYLVWEPDSREALLVDPVREQVERDLKLVEELGLRLVGVIDTHVHADHVTGAGLLRDRCGCRTMSGVGGAPCVDRALADGDVIRLGNASLHVLETRGHTDDSISGVGPNFVFTGDALLVRGCGRTDFQNGDAGALYDAITAKLFTLAPETIVYPGHDYRGHTQSTIAEERVHNTRFAGKTRDAFVTLMGELTLPRPKLLDAAVPANRACGRERQDADA